VTARTRWALGLAVVLASCTGSGFESGSASAPTAVSGGTGDVDALTCWQAEPAGGSEDITFSDVTEQVGLVDPLLGMMAHAAALQDLDADGWVDAFVGTFADRPVEEYQVRGASGPSPDRLLFGGPDGFGLDEAFPEAFGRTSGAAAADLDGDGDLDLAGANHADAHPLVFWLNQSERR
jgi:hypothetical protein